jgi:hypothetical protein
VGALPAGGVADEVDEQLARLDVGADLLAVEVDGDLHVSS